MLADVRLGVVERGGEYDVQPAPQKDVFAVEPESVRGADGIAYTYVMISRSDPGGLCSLLMRY